MGQFVSFSVVTLPDKALDFTQGFQVRDPDGHVMQIAEALADGGLRDDSLAFRRHVLIPSGIAGQD